MVPCRRNMGWMKAEPGDEEKSPRMISRQRQNPAMKTDEPVLVYFQEIRSVPLLDRKGRSRNRQTRGQAEMEHLVFALQSPLLVSILRVIRRRLQEGELTLAEVSEDADKVPADPQEHLHNLLDALAEFEPKPCASKPQSTARNVAVADGLLKSLKSSISKSLLRDVLEEERALSQCVCSAAKP